MKSHVTVWHSVPHRVVLRSAALRHCLTCPTRDIMPGETHLTRVEVLDEAAALEVALDLGGGTRGA